MLEEPDRKERLTKDFLNSDTKPSLARMLIDVKDIFRVDGFPIRAGSQLPAKVFEGPEASSVKKLKDAGALILVKPGSGLPLGLQLTGKINRDEELLDFTSFILNK